MAITGFAEEELNPFGPVQLYRAPGKAWVEKFKALPEHTGELVIMDGARGKRFTCTFTIAEALVHALTVAATRYEPFCKGLMLFIVMAREVEVNPFGPCQLYEAPACGEADKLRVVPSQTVVDPETTGVAGIGLTVA